MWTKYSALRQASWALLNQPLLLGQGHPTCQGIPFSRKILPHSFFLSCCSNLDAPPTSNQNAKNNFAFSLLLSAHSSLQYNDRSSPSRVPFLVPPCQPRHAAPPCFSELGSQLWFLFPTMSNPWTSPGASNSDIPWSNSPAHGPGQGGPPASPQPCLLSRPPLKWSPCSRPTHFWVSVLSTCCQPPFSACST